MNIKPSPVAQRRNPHLVRLNKLYHFLKNTGACVTIKYDDEDGETIRKTYTRDEQVNDLKQLFADGCEVCGTALRDITGVRSYTESDEVGKYANIDVQQKDVIKGIYYNFRDDRECQGALTAQAHNREDLFIKRKFDDYWFANLKNVYPLVQYEIHERCMGYLNDFLNEERVENQPDRLGVDIEDGGPLSELHRPINILSDSEKRDVQEVINDYGQIRDHSFSRAPALISEQIIPGYFSLEMAFKGGKPNDDTHEKQLIPGLFDDKKTWFDEYRYQKIHAMRDELQNTDCEKWPRYVKALILVMNAEFAAVKWWMVDVALEEVLHNLEFYLTYSSDSNQGDHVSRYHLSTEELTSLLEEYNFTTRLDKAFDVDCTNVLSKPVNRYSSLMKANFIYEKSEHLFILRKKLFCHFYNEITYHLKFYPSGSVFYRQMNIYLRKLIRFDLTGF